MNKNVRRLTDGAMMTAIVGLLLVINRQFGGILEELLLFLFPLPLVFYSAKYGMKQSWLVLVAVTLLAFILGTPATMFYVGSESLIGMIYGSGVRRGTDSRRLLIMTMFTSIVVNVLTMLVFAKFFGYDLNAEIGEYEVMFGKLAEANGVVVPPEIDLVNMLRTMIIVSVLLTGVLQGLITHLSSRLLLKRFRYQLPPSTPIVYYYPPKWSGYLGLIGLVAYYASFFRPLQDQLAQSMMQGLGLIGTMYLCLYGLIAVLVFGRVFAPKARGLVILIAIIMFFSMMFAMTIIGFLYITTNWHKAIIEGASHAKENE